MGRANEVTSGGAGSHGDEAIAALIASGMAHVGRVGLNGCHERVV